MATSMTTEKIPAEERRAWRYFAMKKTIVRAGFPLSQKYIGEVLGVTQQAVNKVVSGRGSSYLVRAALSIMTEEDYVRLWGESAPGPSPEQAERLLHLFGVRWCPEYPAKTKHQYQRTVHCLNCGLDCRAKEEK